MICEYLRIAYSELFKREIYYCDFPDPEHPGEVTVFLTKEPKPCFENWEKCKHRNGDAPERYEVYEYPVG